jgi:2-oxoglutarate dehydrogenase E1 component
MQRILGKACGLLVRGRSLFSELAKFQNSFLTTTNIAYIEHLYERWLVDPKAVSPSFAAYFEQLEQGADPHDAYQSPAHTRAAGLPSQASKQIAQQLQMRLMIDTYRSIGHQFARIDPLELPRNKDLHGRLNEELLSAASFGYKAEELNESIVVRNLREEGPERDNGPYTIQAFEDYLRSIYCDKIGFEYMHLLNKAERDFIKRELEEKIESL